MKKLITLTLILSIFSIYGDGPEMPNFGSAQSSTLTGNPQDFVKVIEPCSTNNDCLNKAVSLCTVDVCDPECKRTACLPDQLAGLVSVAGATQESNPELAAQEAANAYNAKPITPICPITPQNPEGKVLCKQWPLPNKGW